MEYLYIVMLLQENGKEINVSNIHKILSSLDKEVEDEKIQFFVSALSVILSPEGKKPDKEIKKEIKKEENKEIGKEVNLINEKFTKMQRRFDYMESSIESMKEKLEDIKSERLSISLVEEKPSNIVQPIGEKHEDMLQPEEEKLSNIVQPIGEKHEDMHQPEEEKLSDIVQPIEEKPENIVQMREVVTRQEKEDYFKTVEERESLNNLSEEAKQSDSQNQPARYVYGIAGKGERESLGNIGLDGANVYTIPYKDACIVVHDCQAEPYESEDENVVKEWLFTQQEVLDIVAEKFDSVLPMSFDMIIEGKSGSDPEEAAIKWLDKNYESFMETLSKIENCQEYGIQVILDSGSLSETIFEKDEKIKKKKEEIDAKPEGIAYMEREILKDLVKERIEEIADQYFKEFYAMIKKYPADIVIGKVKMVGGNQQMLMNLSCLVKKDRVAPLGEALEEIENHEGITVRFSGPWAPYSFVTPEKGAISNGNG